MNYQRRVFVEDTAYKLLNKFNIFSPPVDVKELAKGNGINVIKHSLSDEVSGFLIIKGDSVTIGYNPLHHDNRIRFTIAHELGHFFLNHQRGGLFIDKHKKNFAVLYRNAQSTTGEYEQEIEANTFAAALLMPKRMVIEAVEEYGLDLSSNNESAIENLAKLFKVSSQAMSFRVGNIFYSF